nr:MAG TPA: hypothetical protein [Caudoviricetes sp.]
MSLTFTDGRLNKSLYVPVLEILCQVIFPLSAIVSVIDV